MLPSLITELSTPQRRKAAAAESAAGKRKRNDRSSEADAEAGPLDPGGVNDDRSAIDAVRHLCRLGGRFAKAERHDPVRFRNKLSTSGLRNLGAVGREVEVALAEAFFAGASGQL